MRKYFCPLCRKQYQHVITKRGNEFIQHPQTNCSNRNVSYSGIELKQIKLKGGEEDVEILDKERG